jgi:hypothetical protein
VLIVRYHHHYHPTTPSLENPPDQFPFLLSIPYTHTQTHTIFLFYHVSPLCVCYYSGNSRGEGKGE